jgi:hypothetical protein
MTVEIYGQRYPISNDYDPDYGQWWAWEKDKPDCPNCNEPLHKDSVDFDVDTVRPDVWILQCLYCSHVMKIED